MRRGAFWGSALPALCAGLSAAPAQADTLRDALLSAYNSNPTITASRSQQRAADEDVAIAKAAARPTLNTTTTFTEQVKQQANAFLAPQRQLSAGVNAAMPIFQGGRVRNGIEAAESRNDSGRAQLRQTESNIFVQVVGAYMDVIRDQAIVDLSGNNVKVLETNLQATRDRFQVGDLTRTDVAQSEARLAIARSQLESSQAQLIASRETYLRVVGKVANALEPPPPLPTLPTDADRAVDAAIDNNPALAAAKASSEAAGFDVRVARASRLPQVSAVASGSYFNYLNSVATGAVPGAVSINSGTSASIGAQMTLPLYQGGLPAARIRRAQDVQSQSQEVVVEVERQIVANTRVAMSNYAASLAVIRSSETAVAANELALEGTRAEQGVGTRNILDVLNAEQELLSSRVQLVSARRDSYVAGFQLLAVLGRAEARDLALDGATLYDPDINYRRVRNKAFDWDDDPAPVTQATRTVPSVVGPLGPVLSPPGEAAPAEAVPAGAAPAEPSAPPAEARPGAPVPATGAPATPEPARAPNAPLPLTPSAAAPGSPAPDQPPIAQPPVTPPGN